MMSASQLRSLLKAIMFEAIDLTDLSIRLDRMKSDNHYFNIKMYGLIADGWGNLSDQIRKQGYIVHSLAGAGDVGLFILTVVTGGLAEKSIQYMSGTVLATSVMEAYDRLMLSISERATIATEKSAAIRAVLKVVSKPAATWAAGMALKREFITSADEAISALVSRNAVARIMSKGLTGVFTTAKGGMQQWAYVLEQAGLELSSEIYERRGTLLKGTHNPIVITKRILNDKDLLQDMAFQVNETFWMAGIENFYDHTTTNRTKNIHCAAFAFVNSNMINLWINKEPDLGRNAVDTGWEVTIGTFETYFDQQLLGRLEQAAIQRSDFRLKLLGYALVGVFAGAENLGYTATSKYYTDHFKHKKSETKKDDSANSSEVLEAHWVPVFQQL